MVPPRAPSFALSTDERTLASRPASRPPVAVAAGSDVVVQAEQVVGIPGALELAEPSELLRPAVRRELARLGDSPPMALTYTEPVFPDGAAIALDVLVPALVEFFTNR